MINMSRATFILSCLTKTDRQTTICCFWHNGGIYWENTTWTGGEVSPEWDQGINIDLGIIGIIYEVTHKGLAVDGIGMCGVCVCEILCIKLDTPL